MEAYRDPPARSRRISDTGENRMGCDILEH